jgi:hypothetical protein
MLARSPTKSQAAHWFVESGQRSIGGQPTNAVVHIMTENAVRVADQLALLQVMCAEETEAIEQTWAW